MLTSISVINFLHNLKFVSLYPLHLFHPHPYGKQTDKSLKEIHFQKVTSHYLGEC